MTPSEIAFVLEVFKLSGKDLARSLNVSPSTFRKWQQGTPEPLGLPAQVLRALHSAAQDVQGNEAKVSAVRGFLLLGVGAMLHRLLSETCRDYVKPFSKGQEG